MTLANVNKIKASECHTVRVLYCICIMENVSSHTVLTK